MLQALPPWLQDYVRGFADARPHRVVAPDAQGFYSVMSELLAHNRQIRDRAVLPPVYFSCSPRRDELGGISGTFGLPCFKRAPYQGGALGITLEALPAYIYIQVGRLDGWLVSWSVC